MRLLHFDIHAGISGDMSVAALTHLGTTLDPLTDALQAMGLSTVHFQIEQVQPSGISAFRFHVKDSEQTHQHRKLEDILGLLDKAGLPAEALQRSRSIFTCLAQAEAQVHGIEPQQVSFHEVGAIDSIVDVVACALALQQLAPDVITSSSMVLGSGLTQSQHGLIPIPAPATLELLKGIPVRSVPVSSELTTPTGAAIVKSQVDRFCDWPNMKPEAIGYGTGTRELPNRPNLLRVVLGQAEQQDQADDELLVSANIDDMNPEHFEYLLEQLFENGAHDVWMQPIVMKKSRAAIMISLLCARHDLQALEETLFRESTTIGLRRQVVQRRKLARHHKPVETPWGVVRMKVASEGETIYTASPEYEDCQRLARSQRVSLKQIYAAAMRAWLELAKE